ncbi:HK97 family protein [Xanthomonas phage Kintu]
MVNNAKKYGLEGSFAAQLQEFADMVQQDADEVFQIVATEVGQSVINLTPVDTGRALSNWNAGINSPDDTYRETEDPMDSQTSSRLAGEFSTLKFGDTAYITNATPHIPFLEYGSSKQAPNGFVRITLARFNNIVQDAVRRVAK